MGKSIVLFLLTIGAQSQESPYSTSDYLADTLMDRALLVCAEPAELDDATVGKGGAARAPARAPASKGGKAGNKVMPMSPGTGAYEAFPGFKPGRPVANGAGFTQTLPDPRVAGDYKVTLGGNIFGREKMAKEGNNVGVKTKMNRPQRWGQQVAEDGLLPCQMPPKKNIWR
jgi:hypothetical protein